MSGISGTLRIAEANHIASDIRERVRGSSGSYLLILLALVAGGAGSAVAIVAGLGFARPLPFAIVGAFAGWWVYALIIRRVATWRFRSRLLATGMPDEFAYRLEISPEALICESGDMLCTVKWSGVSELFYSRGYWVFLAQSQAILAPERYFSGRQAERAFVAEALGYMGDAARAKSVQALAFIAAGAA